MVVVRNFQEPSHINYRTLAAGLDYYESHGYPYKEVPWVVGDEAINSTLPEDREATTVSYGSLVGSGEQSFIELKMRGKEIEKSCCITPCFRDEGVFDELHHAYFMKLELIDPEATQHNLHSMISDALGFFNQYIDAAVIKTGPDMFDIVDKKQGIELGSYGFRTVGSFKFIYGTGVALPRLDTAKAS